MILVIEIILAVMGLKALFTGTLKLSNTKVVVDVPARLLGVLALTPLPLAFFAIMAYTVTQDPQDPERFADNNKLALVGIEAGIVIFISILVFAIGSAVAISPAEAKYREQERRRAYDRYDDDQYDNRDVDRDDDRYDNRRDDDRYDDDRDNRGRYR
jgi:hypothetical protein